MSWYVARVATNCERRAEIYAAKAGMESRLYMAYQPVMVQGRSVLRQSLAFPGYMFLKFNDLAVWHKARRQSFVFTGLLGCGLDEVESVSEAIIKELDDRMVNGAIHLEVPKCQYKNDDKVRVARGRYADLVGLVTGTSAQRVDVLLSMFNRHFIISLDESLVVAA